MEIKKQTAASSVPGVFAGISNEDYHSGPGVSKSSLDVIAKSPLHYWDRYINPNRRPTLETAAMKFGTAFHTCVLEPEEYRKWVVLENVDRRTKDGKRRAEEAEELARSQGGRIIGEADFEVIEHMSAAISNHSVGKFLEAGTPELSVYWIDEESGVFCRCRPDWLGTDAVIDLKTTEDASPKGFGFSAWKYRYHVQAAFYLDGLAANGIHIPNFIFAAVEKSRPYPVVGFVAEDEFVEAGRREYKRLLKIYADCAAANTWNGYVDFVGLTLPPWVKDGALDNEEW